MPDFKEKLMRHVEHVKNVGPHCTTEETTKQALILPFLNILDFSPFDPLKVKAEYCADLPGIKANERVDYALFSESHPVMFIEAKSFCENLTNHAGQLARYFNATPGVAIAAITNGKEWRFFTDLKRQNIMDDTPFLVVDFMGLSETAPEQLARFRYDRFSPDRLRTFAEERVYLGIFQNVIETCLKEVDQDFVRFVAIRANLSPKLTTKVLESMTPLVKQSVADAISKMVVSGLSTPPPPTVAEPANAAVTDSEENLIDSTNPKIVTTVAERKILDIMKDMLGGQVNPVDIVAKDTESYYTMLYQGKVNRWLLRYQGDRKKPLGMFIFDFTDEHKAQVAKAGLELGPGNSVVLDKPESLMRLSGLIFDALAFCKDDNNFKTKKGADV
ncbi:MAG: hypothetical protein FD174_4083 [Geobacteraceae bacterium]|nr:MAG: hypothetical protein FD174_4083 [Geobacteraceae bacterium]